MEKVSFLEADGITREIVDAKAREMLEGLGGGGGVVVTTYDELKTLRDNGELAAGTWYRITDYECTTKQDFTRSAGHSFDILVLALDEYTLSEEARAIRHEGDTYFESCDVEAWKIWYSFENDTNRFAWAANEKHFMIEPLKIFEYFDKNVIPEDFENTFMESYGGCALRYFVHSYDEGEMSVYECKSEGVQMYLDETRGVVVFDSLEIPIEEFCDIKESGKGVIYRMIDECGNDAPYDFKNIQYCRSRICLDDCGEEGYYSNEFNGDFIWAYTFCHIEEAGSPEGDFGENDTYERYNVYDESLQIDVQNNERGSICFNNVIGNNCYNMYESYFELSNIVMYNCVGMKLDSASTCCTFVNCCNIKGMFNNSFAIGSELIEAQSVEDTLFCECSSLNIGSLYGSTFVTTSNTTIGEICGTLYVHHSENLTFMNGCQDINLGYIINSTFHNCARRFFVSSYESLYEGNEIKNLVVFGGDYNSDTMYFYPYDKEVKFVTANGYSWYQTQGDGDV